jgi:hypothetical protein
MFNIKTNNQGDLNAVVPPFNLLKKVHLTQS